MGSKKTLPIYYPFGTQTPTGVTPIAVTGTNTYTSPSTFIANLDNVGAQVIWTGTPTGVLTVNVSNDNVDFDSLTFNPALAQPAGAPLKYVISLNQLPWPYVQFQYTNSAGSGTLFLSIFGKDLN